MQNVLRSTGARASMNQYYEQSQMAEIRANASTIDPDNLVNQSATLRTETEDLMNQTKEEFIQRQDEDAKKLDNLAGQLETLDLSELSEKVKQSNRLMNMVKSLSYHWHTVVLISKVKFLETNQCHFQVIFL